MNVNVWTGRNDDGIDGMDILFCYDGFWGIPSQSSPHDLAIFIFEAEREEEEVQGKGEKAFVRGRREGGVTCTLSYLYNHQIFLTGCPPDVRACVVWGGISDVFIGVRR